MLLKLSTSRDPWITILRQRRFRPAVKKQDVAWFFRQLSILVSAGVPLLRCLKVLRDQAGNRSLQGIIGEVYQDLERGASLSDALASRPQVFPPLACRMVRSGETGGHWEEVLERLASYLEKEAELGQQMKNAALYPALLALFALGVLLFLIIYVVPRMTQAFNAGASALPVSTRIMLGLGRGIGDNLALIVMSIVGLAAVLKWVADTPRGRAITLGIQQSLPLVGRWSTQLAVARFASSLGLMLQSGTGILRALELAEAMLENRRFAQAVARAREEISRGGGIARTLENTGWLDPIVIQMIAVGEESGKLGPSLLQAAKYCESEAERLMKSGITLLEPTLIIIMALAVGLVVSGTILPMLDAMASF